MTHPNMQIQGQPKVEQLTPEQQQQQQQQMALDTAKTNIALCRDSGSMNSTTAAMMNTMLESYNAAGFDIRSLNLPLDTLQKIQNAQHETVMTIMTEWADFMREQAKLDQEASNKSRQLAQELQKMLFSEQPGLLREGKLKTDPRLVARMTPEQKQMHNIALKLSELMDVDPASFSTTETVGEATVVSDAANRPKASFSSVARGPVLQEARVKAGTSGISTGNTGNQVRMDESDRRTKFE